MDNYTVPKIIGIWGGGLIGMSTAVHFARKGIKSVVYDINAEQVDRINNCIFPVGFEDWVGFRVSDYIIDGTIRATTNNSDLRAAGITTHFVVVPTENRGEPYMDIIKTVLQEIKDMDPELCIIESTLVPGQTEILGRRFGLMENLGVAIRRDWFTASENNLANCVRVYCGLDKSVSERMVAILSLVCRNLLKADSCTAVELTKCLDNGLIHAIVMYASQIAVGYPDADSAEALRLAAKHWRFGNHHVFFPSIGTGGHCVPLANKYLIHGASDPKKLTIAEEAIKYDKFAPQDIARMIKERVLGPEDKVAVLGISYRGDISQHIGSPHVKFACELVELKVSVGIHDPYYTADELKQIVGDSITPLDFPDDLKEYNFIYVGANHSEYAKKLLSVLAYLKPGQRILDNQGIWEAIADDARNLGIIYHRVGSAGWLPMPDNTEEKSTVQLTPEQGPPIVFDTKYLKVRAIPDPRTSTSSITSDPYYVVKRQDSVTVICYSTASTRFLLQKQYRAHVNIEAWEFPMGSIDEGEEPIHAASRELYEETSLNIPPSELKQLGTYRPVPGLSPQRTFVFYAEVTDEQFVNAKPAREEGITEFKPVNAAEFKAMIAKEEIIDGFTIAAFTMWQAGSEHIQIVNDHFDDVESEISDAMNSLMPGSSR